MKYIVIYKFTETSKAVIGFTNSLENFLANNAKRTRPYKYDKENIELVELHEDVFGAAWIEGTSNFCDYLR